MTDVPPRREPPPLPLRGQTGEHARLYLDGEDATRLLLEFAAIRENTTKILAAITEDRARQARIESDAAHEKEMNSLAHEKIFDRLDALEKRGWTITTGWLVALIVLSAFGVFGAVMFLATHL